MSFKTCFHIALEDGNKRNTVNLNREIELRVSPCKDMVIRLNYRKQKMKIVIYDVDKDIFIVELKSDDSLSLGFSKRNVEDLVNDYLKEGWERTVSLDLEERVKNLKISSAVSEIEYAIKDLKLEASVRKMSEIIVKFDSTESVGTEQIFNMLNLPHSTRMLVLNDINRMLSEKDIPAGTEEEISNLSFNELLEAIRETEDRTTGNVFINIVSRLIFESGITQEMNIHQVFYFAKIPPEKGNVIMSRLKDLREIRE